MKPYWKAKSPETRNYIKAFLHCRASDLPFWISAKNVQTFRIDKQQTLVYALWKKCNADVIRFLLETAGKQDNYVNYDSMSFEPPDAKFYFLPLTRACINGDTTVINLLLDAGARFVPEQLSEKLYKEHEEFLWGLFSRNPIVTALLRRRKPEFVDPRFAMEEVISQFENNMVKVQGGSFTMGCKGDQSACGVAWPAVQVSVDSFYISKYEVTQQQWQAIMKFNPSINNNCPSCPVEKVSWEEVQSFITRINEISGKKFRLPTEKEWEFAARGGNHSAAYIYAGSNNLDSVAWYKINTTSPKPVGQRQPNELGLYDMSGNIMEWCQSFYTPTLEPYKSSPNGPEQGVDRVVKGGSRYKGDYHCQPNRRYGYNPQNQVPDAGFRLVMDK